MTTGRRHRRHITPDEAKLWRAVTKQFVPLAPERQAEPVAEAHSAAHQSAAGPTVRKTPQAMSAPASAKIQHKADVPLAEFEHKRARRLTSGRLPIEARLDLHGLRQNEAHSELLSFLRSAQNNGLKHVKVITGKGVAGAQEPETRPFSLFDDSPRGVLREQVPRWLGEPAFRVLVVSFTMAGRGHGGGGALYVQVRKRSAR